MKPLFSSLILAITLLSPSIVAACDRHTGDRAQAVFLSWNGQRLENWEANMGTVHRVELPNGFQLGVKLDHPPTSRYLQLSNRLEHIPELVQIELFDYSGHEPSSLSLTYGGTNSIQGFGASGGANRVSSLGDPGVELTLLMPVCTDLARISAAE